MYRKYFTCLLLLAVLLASVSVAGAKTLAVIPFTIHAQGDLSYLADGTASMLGTRLAAGAGLAVIDPARVRKQAATAGRPLDRSAATAIGQTLKADYIIYGSITRLGDQFSLDAEVIDISGDTPPTAVYQQAASLGGVIPAVDALAGDIIRQAFPAAGLPTAGTPASRPAPSTRTHPEKLLNTPTAAPATTAGTPAKPAFAAPMPTPPASLAPPNSSFIQTGGSAGAPDFWKSRDLAMEVDGLAVADLTGDGQNEIVLIAADRLDVWKIVDRRFFKLAEQALAPREKPLMIDAVDTDGNGKAEIFVTALNTNSDRICSFVLEFEDPAATTTDAGAQGRSQAAPLIRIADNQRWYFRCLGPNTICGQKQGMSDLFLPPIYQLVRSGDQYIKAGALDIPGNWPLPAVTRGDIRHNGHIETLVSDDNDKLRLYDTTGELIWKSGDRFGGSETFLVKTEETDGTLGQRTYFPQRVLIADLDGNGANEVLTVTNEDVASRVLQRFRQYSGATFACLTWDGLGLSEIWRTRKTSGYVADFALADIDNDGHLEIAAAILRTHGSLLTKAKSCVIAYDLDTTP